MKITSIILSAIMLFSLSTTTVAATETNEQLYTLNELIQMNDEEFLTLDKDTGIDVFDYSVYGKAAADSAKITPRIDVEKDGYKKETLIGYDDTPCFAEIKHTLSNASFTLENAPAVYICIDGNGQIKGENYCREIKRGSYFFLPHCAKGKFNVSGSLTLIECLPSKQDD